MFLLSSSSPLICLNCGWLIQSPNNNLTKYKIIPNKIGTGTFYELYNYLLKPCCENPSRIWFEYIVNKVNLSVALSGFKIKINSIVYDKAQLFEDNKIKIEDIPSFEEYVDKKKVIVELL